IAAILFFFEPRIVGFFARYLDLWLLPAAILVAGAACWWLVVKKREQVLSLVRSIAPAVAVLVIATLAVDVLLYGVRHVVLAEVLAPEIDSGKLFIIGILATFAGIVSTLPIGLGAYDATLVAL